MMVMTMIMVMTMMMVDGHDNYDDAIQGLSQSYRAPMIDAMTYMDNNLTDTKKSQRLPKVRKTSKRKQNQQLQSSKFSFKI